MKKILGIMAALMIVGGVAMAQDDGGSAITCGNQEGGGGSDIGNPGEAFELYEGLLPDADNPREIFESINPNRNEPVKNLGKLVQDYCTTPGDDASGQ